MMPVLNRSLRIAFLFLSLFCIFFLTGCRESKEINDMAIVTGISLDWDPNLREYEVVGETASQIPDLGAISEEMHTVEGRGLTVTAALANCEEGEERQIYRSHSKIFILDRDLAGNGIRPLLDHVIRNYDTRLSVDLLLVDDELASDVWGWNTGSSGIKAFDLEELLMTGEDNSLIPRLKAYQAAELLQAKGLSITMPMIAKDGEGQVRLSGAAVFRRDRMVGQLDEQETLFLLFLQNRIKNCQLTLPAGTLPKATLPVTLHVENSRTTLTPKWDGRTLSMEVKIKVKAALSEAAVQYSNANIASAMEKMLTSGCLALIEKAEHQLHSDIFGFGRAVNRYHPQLFSTLSTHWDEAKFSQLPVTVDCTVEIIPGEVSY